MKVRGERRKVTVNSEKHTLGHIVPRNVNVNVIVNVTVKLYHCLCIGISASSVSQLRITFTLTLTFLGRIGPCSEKLYLSLSPNSSRTIASEY